MKELSFRRERNNIVCAFSICALVVIILLYVSIKTGNLACLAIAVIYASFALMSPMYTHGYDMVHIGEKGITVEKFFILKKKKEKEFLPWEDVKDIDIVGSIGGTSFIVYRPDNTTIKFYYSREIYTFISSVYPKKIDNHYY